MNTCNRLHTTSCIALILAFAVGGCATSLPSGQRIEFPERKYSVISPSSDWETIKAPAGSGVAWQSKFTGSQIHINTYPISPASYSDLAKLFIKAFGVFGGDLITVTQSKEKEVNYDGKTFYQVFADLKITHPNRASVRANWIVYFFKTEEAFYMLGMFLLNRYYEADFPVLDEMVRSFRYSR